MQYQWVVALAAVAANLVICALVVRGGLRSRQQRSFIVDSSGDARLFARSVCPGDACAAGRRRASAPRVENSIESGVQEIVIPQ